MKLNVVLALVTIVSGLGTARADDIIVRGPFGHPMQLSWEAAARACPAGTRLPTARELAVWASARGAKGILESSQVDPNAVPAGYSLVSVVNPDGKSDSFYFNQEGYRYTVEGSNKYDFWSSSTSAKNRYDAAAISYFGLFYMYPQSGPENVLCVPAL